MIQLADKVHCTACGACAFVCPKHCISMEENQLGVVYPVVNEKDCISCKGCQNVCPIIAPVDFRTPSNAYAAWSSNDEERRTSASGGIAAEIYKSALKSGYYITGAIQNKDFSVSLEMSDSIQSIAKFKNSKYVFSSAYSLFPKIREALKEKRNVLVIGLPCQIAAIRKIFHNNENLFLVDVVCHGTTPYNYLLQHIHTLEAEYGQKAVRMSFRDPDTYTYTYTFTLYNAKGQRFCERTIQEGDAYQVGYHRKITYRENCYHCYYAKSQRVSDLTIADYHGLGRCEPCGFSDKNVSLILVNDSKGNAILNKLQNSGSIIAHERPLEEPVKGEPQLRHPSPKTLNRKDFEKLYNGNFAQTMEIILRRYYRRERIKKLKENAKKTLKKIIITMIRRKK